MLADKLQYHFVTFILLEVNMNESNKISETASKITLKIACCSP